MSHATLLPLGSASQAAEELRAALAAGDYERAARLARELSELLARVQRAIGEAASGAGAAALGEAASRLEKARGLWSEVLEEQSRVLEETQRLEEGRLSLLLEAQRELLARLEAREALLLSSAAAGALPLPAEALSGMKAAQGEFAARRVVNAEAQLGGVVARLRAESARHPQEPAAEWFAAAQEDILRLLRKGPSPPILPGPESAAAAKAQAACRAKTAELGRELEGVAALLPEGILERLAGAQGEQASAEGALEGGDSQRALGHEEKALSLLEQCGRGISDSAARQKGVEAGLSQPFAPAAVRVVGPVGSRLGAVPLPSAKDYRPPRELREELERSLRERRPEAFDRIVKEYFKRISR